MTTKSIKGSLKMMMIIALTAVLFTSCSSNTRFLLSGDRHPHGHVQSRTQGHYMTYATPKKNGLTQQAEPTSALSTIPTF